MKDALLKLYVLQYTIDGTFYCHHSRNFTEPDKEKATRWSAMSANDAMHSIAVLRYGKCPIADHIKIIPLTHSEIKDYLRVH